MVEKPDYTKDKGDTGAQGATGAQGDPGAPGATGETGPPGTTTWAGITDKPSTFAPTAHKTDHQDAGADEISAEGLAGELTAEQKSAWAKISGIPSTFAPTAHKTDHQDGGGDEISVEGLAGELTAEQKSAWIKVSGKPSTFAPTAHKTDHQPGGSDDILAVPKSLFTTAGDIIYATAAGVLARLAVVANKRLFGNAAGDALEYATGIKVGSFTYNLATITGTQDITDVGFAPSAIVLFGVIGNLAPAFWTIADQSSQYGIYTPQYAATPTPGYHDAGTMTIIINSANLVSGFFSAWLSNGFRISWTKVGSPTGTLKAYYMAFR